MAKRIHDLNERVQDIRREQAAQRVNIDTRVKNGGWLMQYMIGT